MNTLRFLPLLLTTALASAATDWPAMSGPLGTHGAVDPDLSMDWSKAGVAWRFRLTGNRDARDKTKAYAPAQLAIRDGKVFAVDRDADSSHAILRVLDLADGSAAWTFAWRITEVPPEERSPQEQRMLAASEERPHAGPAVGAKHVFLSGPIDGTFRAVDLQSHAEAWVADLPKLGLTTSGKTKPQILDDLVLLIARNKEGDVLLAFDQATGALRWQCLLPKVGGGFYTRIENAPVVLTMQGVRQVVVHHQRGIAGVSPSGDRLWNWDGYQRGTIIATPSVSPDGYIFVQSGHTGSRALGHITLADGVWKCETIFCDPKDSRMHGFVGQGHAQTTGAAWWDGAFYMGTTMAGLQCMLPDGSIPWADACVSTDGRGKEIRGTGIAEHAPVIVVNGRLLTLTGPGDLLIATANPKEYQELGRVKLGAPTLMLPAYSAGRVVVVSARSGQVVCVDLVGGVGSGNVRGE